MRLLLTRAADDAARTCAKLQAAGHEVVCAPLLRIVPLATTWPDGRVDAVLATSSHAFAALPRPGLPRSELHWGPSAEARRTMPLLLVGSRTLEAARASGFLGRTTLAANATALAVGLGKGKPRARRLVYLAGRERKPDIEAALLVMKQPLDVLETYDAQATDPTEADAHLRAGEIDGVLHFSQRSAGLFLDLARAAAIDPAPLWHICLSEDVTAPLRAAGLELITVADAPTEAALLECLARVQALNGGKVDRG